MGYVCFLKRKNSDLYVSSKNDGPAKMERDKIKGSFYRSGFLTVKMPSTVPNWPRSLL
jgi:hypothetical protein